MTARSNRLLPPTKPASEVPSLASATIGPEIQVIIDYATLHIPKSFWRIWQNAIHDYHHEMRLPGAVDEGAVERTFEKFLKDLK
jgi:hypothetical protein